MRIKTVVHYDYLILNHMPEADIINQLQLEKSQLSARKLSFFDLEVNKLVIR